MPDTTPAASPSTPWFTLGTATSGQANTITSQRSALNQAVNGVAADLSGQNTSLLTAINGVASAITALASR